MYAGFRRERKVPSDQGGRIVADESTISILGKWINSGVNSQIQDQNKEQV